MKYYYPETEAETKEPVRIHRDPVDLIGKTFGRLTVTAPAEPAKNGSMRLTCECKCGNVTTVLLKSLLSGNTRSCGCYRKDRASLLAQPKHSKGVIDPETGKTWPSMLAFAKEHGVSPPSVTQAVKRKGKVAGILLETVKEHQERQANAQ